MKRKQEDFKDTFKRKLKNDQGRVIHWTFRPLKKRPQFCPEISGITHPVTRRKNPEDRRPRLHGCQVVSVGPVFSFHTVPQRFSLCQHFQPIS